jgi:radical SAM superfamily enzyme YgiQ (UPF0313 family)
MTGRGFPIVLTADRTLMAAYPLLLDGMGAASQTTFTPGAIMTGILARPVPHDGAFRARVAPLGLRRIEAALLRAGYGVDDVAIVPPEKLHHAIGPATRIVGVSSGDPLGLGMNSTTMAGIFGGRPHTSAQFQKLMGKLRGIMSGAASPARLVVGGPGAWQLVGDEAACQRLGIDHVIAGYCEENVGDLCRRIAAGEELPLVLEGRGPRTADVPAVVGATVMGMVEASRGCGWGCQFCTLSREPMGHLPVETILADVETNLRAGVRNISLGSEDIFRYGAAPGERVAPGRLIDLLRRVRGLAGVRTLAIDHANVASVAQFSDSELAEVQRLVSGGPGRLVWMNLGVETASGRLLAANGGAVKMKPFALEEWGEVCLTQVRRLCRHGFLPMASLVIGLPGETAEDTERTLRWVESLSSERVSVVAVFHTAVTTGGGRIAAGEVTRRQWEVFDRALTLTFRWMPGLYWQHHGAAGVAMWRRVLMQVFGRFYAPCWKFLVRRRRRKAL